MRVANKLKEYEGLSAKRDLSNRSPGHVFFSRYSVKKIVTLDGTLPSREMARVKAPMYLQVCRKKYIVENSLCALRERTYTSPYFIIRMEVTVDFSWTRR